MKAEIVSSGHGVVVPMAYVWLGNVLLIQGHRELARARLANKRKKENRHDLYSSPSRHRCRQHRTLHGTSDDRAVLLRKGAEGSVRPRVRPGDAALPEDNAHPPPELRHGAHLWPYARRGAGDDARKRGESLVRAERDRAARVLVRLDPPLDFHRPAPLRGLHELGDRCAPARLARGARALLPR